VAPRRSLPWGVDRVELSSPDEIFFSALLDFRGQESKRSLFRFQASLDLVEIVDMDVELTDFILESPQVALGVSLRKGNRAEFDDRNLYRVNLDTGATEVVFESDLLLHAYRIALDPQLKPVILTVPHDEVPAQLIRLNLATQEVERIVELDPTFRFPADMDIVIVPEAATLELIVIGLIGTLAIARPRQHPGRGTATKAANRTFSSGCRTPLPWR
jgi:hypothetical protein